MASYHCSIKDPISRGKGQSVTAKAAYNGRTQLRDERTGEFTKDYGSRGGHVESYVLIGDKGKDAPAWFKTDRQRLISAAVKAERYKNAREGQEIVFGFIHELGPEKSKWIMNDTLRETLLRGTGRVALVDLHIHGKRDRRNSHAHVILLQRAAGPDGFSKTKLPALEPEDYQRIRGRYAELGAKALHKEAAQERKAGNEERAAYLEIEAERFRWGHLSNPEQKQKALERGDLAWAKEKEKPASKHRGPKVDAMEARGIETDRGNIYRDTEKSRRDNQAARVELDELQDALAQYEHDWTEAVAKAAIDKEKAERRFVEPKPEPETRRGAELAGGQGPQPVPVTQKDARLRELAEQLYQQKKPPDLSAQEREALKEKLADFGFDPSKPGALNKWQKRQPDVDAGRITEKDRLREMALFLWQQSQKDRRHTPPEPQRDREKEPERDI